VFTGGGKSILKTGGKRDMITKIDEIVHRKFISKRGVGGDGGAVHDADIRKFGIAVMSKC